MSLTGETARLDCGIILSTYDLRKIDETRIDAQEMWIWGESNELGKYECIIIKKTW